MAAKKKPEPATTHKLAILTWRPPDSDQWQAEALTFTAFTLTASGALALYAKGSVIRILAPGMWAGLAVVSESPVEPYVER